MKEKQQISKRKKVKFIFFTLTFLATILFFIFELVLYLAHYQSSYDRMKGFSFEQANWWNCDSVTGPGYVQNKVDKTDSVTFKNSGVSWYYNRLKIVNEQGYHDKRNFTEITSNNDSLKVLFAGDSFTWGASADVDSSYVDVFKQDLNKSIPNIVWNTGIPATGTNHALFVTKKFLPVQKSNFVILGFYVGNDFVDNLTPFNRLVFTKNSDCYNLYDYDKNFQPFKIEKRDAFKKATGSYPLSELNLIQKMLVHSRVITFINEYKEKIFNKVSGFTARKTQQEYNATKNYLKQLNDYVKENNAELIVLPIPIKDDVKSKSSQYLNAINILDELSVKYFENINLLTEKNYYQSKNDGHWNNSGHILTGHALSKYLLDYISKKQNSQALH